MYVQIDAGEKRGAAFARTARPGSLHVPLHTMRRASGGGCEVATNHDSKAGGCEAPARFSPLGRARLAIPVCEKRDGAWGVAQDTTGRFLTIIVATRGSALRAMIVVVVRQGEPMEGIHFVTNAKGKKIAVQIDLDRYGELWEDVYDQLLVEQRRHEKRESFSALEKRLIKAGKLRG
jgi:hypothetical protein